MAETVENLDIRISANADDYDATLDQAVASVDAFERAVEQSMGAASSAVAGMADKVDKDMAEVDAAMKGVDDLEVVATANTADLKNGMDDVADSVATSTEKAGGSWLNFQNIIMAGVAMMLTAVLGIGTAAFDVAGSFDQANRDIAASFGMSTVEAQELTEVVEQVYGNNFGDSIEDASASVIAIGQQMKTLATEDIGAATEAALMLRDTFGVDVAESANAANTLMTEFGLTSQEAFDMLTAGFQGGLDTSGDFLDTIGEYSVQFKESGASAAQFYNVLESGIQGGVLGTDKIADALKESRILIMENGESLITAFTDIGASMGKADFGVDAYSSAADQLAAYEAMIKQFGLEAPEFMTLGLEQGATDFASAFASTLAHGVEKGTLSVADAQQIIVDNLGKIDNNVRRNTAGVAIFGTQWEDAGEKAILGLNMADTGMEEMAGMTDTLNAKYGSLGSVIEGAWRGIQLNVLKPVGDELLAMANTAIPVVQAGMAAFGSTMSSTVGPAISQISGVVSTTWASIQAVIAEHGPAIMAKVSEVWTRVKGIIDETLPPVQAIVMTVFGAVATFLDTHGAEIQATIGTVWNTIGVVIDGALAFIEQIIIPGLQTIAAFIGEHSGLIGGLLSGAWQIIQGVIQVSTSIISGVVTTFLALVTGDWSGAWTAITEMFSGVWEGIKTILGGALAFLTSALSLGWEAIRGHVETAWGAIGSFFSGWWDTIKAGAQLAMDTMTGAIANGMAAIGAKVGEFVQLGANLIAGITQGVKDAAGALYDATVGVIADAWDGVTDFLDMHSPSRRAHDELGVMWIRGITGGAVAEGPALTRAMVGVATDAFTATTDAVASAGASVVEAGANIMAGLTGSMEDTFKIGSADLVGQVHTMMTQIGEAVHSVDMGASLGGFDPAAAFGGLSAGGGRGGRTSIGLAGAGLRMPEGLNVAPSEETARQMLGGGVGAGAGQALPNIIQNFLAPTDAIQARRGTMDGVQASLRAMGEG